MKSPWPYFQYDLQNGYYEQPPLPVRYKPKRLSDGTEIQVAQPRVGDDEREWVARRLDEMWSRGYLSQREHEERHAAAFAAVTRDQLNVLLKDLPDDPGEWREIRKDASPVIKVPEKLTATGVAVSFVRPSLVMLLFAVIAIIFGASLMSVSASNGTVLIAGAGAAVIGIVHLAREIHKL